jgi:ATP-dependent DNA ligase
MLAKRADELPAGQTWIFEPKWDGFRALIFRDRDEILMQSRDAKSLNRYFPELLESLGAQLPARCVLDGEIIVAKNEGLDFEELQLGIHPVASSVKLLLRQSSASIVFFDLLCEGGRDWRSEPFERRREKLAPLLVSAVRVRGSFWATGTAPFVAFAMKAGYRHAFKSTNEFVRIKF